MHGRAIAAANTSQSVLRAIVQRRPRAHFGAEHDTYEIAILSPPPQCENRLGELLLLKSSFMSATEASMIRFDSIRLKDRVLTCTTYTHFQLPTATATCRSTSTRLFICPYYISLLTTFILFKLFTFFFTFSHYFSLAFYAMAPRQCSLHARNLFLVPLAAQM